MYDFENPSARVNFLSRPDERRRRASVKRANMDGGGGCFQRPDIQSGPECIIRATSVYRTHKTVAVPIFTSGSREWRGGVGGGLER